MHRQFELEIQSNLILLGSPEAVVKAIAEKYLQMKCGLELLSSIAHFFIKAGAYQPLLLFLNQKFEQEEKIPWGHYLHALKALECTVSSEFALHILEAASQQKLVWELVRSKALDSFDPELRKERDLRRQAQLAEFQTLKQDLLVQIDMYRSQEMEQQEGLVLARLTKMFPKDDQIAELFTDFRNRMALALLEKKRQDRALGLVATNANTSHQNQTSLTPEEHLQIHDWLEQWDRELTARQTEPKIIEDAVMFFIFLEAWSAGDSLLKSANAASQVERSPNLRGAMTEVLLKLNRPFELLADCLKWESSGRLGDEEWSQVHLAKAQALRLMGRKKEAVEMLEELLTLNPQHRTTNSLLYLWKKEEDPSS